MRVDMGAVTDGKPPLFCTLFFLPHILIKRYLTRQYAVRKLSIVQDSNASANRYHS